MNKTPSRLSRFLMLWVPVTIIELIFAVNHTPIPIGSIAGLTIILLLWKVWRARRTKS